jgi:type II secretory pathway pseudopilin PulG
MAELAIVLGIVGIILAAIWTYLGSAQDNANRQKLTEELSAVVNNIHALYAGQASIGASGDSISVVTPFLIQESAIPSTMVRSGGGCTNVGPPAGLCVDTPWGPVGNAAGGTFGVCAWTALPKSAPAGTVCPAAGTTTTQSFAIELSGVTQASCVSITPQDSGPGGPVGLQDVLINGISAGGSLPVSVAFANTNCTAASKIDFVYRLQAPTF